MSEQSTRRSQADTSLLENEGEQSNCFSRNSKQIAVQNLQYYGFKAKNQEKLLVQELCASDHRPLTTSDLFLNLLASVSGQFTQCGQGAPPISDLRSSFTFGHRKSLMVLAICCPVLSCISLVLLDRRKKSSAYSKFWNYLVSLLFLLLLYSSLKGPLLLQTDPMLLGLIH